MAPRTKNKPKVAQERINYNVDNGYKQYPISPIQSFSIEAIKSICNQFINGQFRIPAHLSLYLTRNSSVIKALNIRKNQLFSLPSGYRTDSGKSDTNSVKKLKSVFKYMVSDDLLEKLWISYVFHGIGIAQVVWASYNGELLPTLEYFHLQNVRYDINTQKYLAMTQDKGEIIITDEEFLIMGGCADKANERQWENGLLPPLALKAVMSDYSLTDWLNYTQMNGSLKTVLYVPESAELQDKRDFINGAINGGGNQTMVCMTTIDNNKDIGFDAKILEPQNNTYQNFDLIKKSLESDIEGIILGRQIESSSGVYNPLDFTSGILVNTLKKDAETVNRFVYDLCWLYYSYNFIGEDCAYWYLDGTPPEDSVRQASVLETITKALPAIQEGLKADGKVLDVQAYFQMFNITLPVVKANPAISANETPNTKQVDNKAQQN